MPFQFFSTAFTDGGWIPELYSCQGADTLRLSNGKESRPKRAALSSSWTTPTHPEVPGITGFYMIFPPPFITCHRGGNRVASP